MSLRRIFHNSQSVTMGERLQLFYVASLSVQMNRQKGTRAGRKQWFDLRRVQQCCFVHIAEDGAQSRAHHRLGTCHKRHGRYNHLVAFIPAFHLAQGQQNKCQCI